MQKVVITGAAGFIGFHTALALLKQNITVVGIDNLNDYYAPQLKHDRLAILQHYDHFYFELADISDAASLTVIWEKHSGFPFVIHLAAQAGVRYSIKNPEAYVQSNMIGFFNVLQLCKQTPNLQHFIYASTSSVYGLNDQLPLKESYVTDKPISFYAATKLSNENMAQSYYSLYNLPVTGLRYFTVYGPFGRPDMAPFKFTKAILNEEIIDVFGHGQLERDFTYIDDIVEGTISALHNLPKPYIHDLKHPIYNLGYGQPITVENFIFTLEKHLGKKAVKNHIDNQLGDVHKTLSDCTLAKQAFGYSPQTCIDQGLEQFIKWYKDYYKI